MFGETKYILSMEWLPNDVPKTEVDGLNPAGTAVVTMDIHTHKWQSISFVEGTTFATSKGI